MSELVYEVDLKSSVRYGRAGSSPALSTSSQAEKKKHMNNIPSCGILQYGPSIRAALLIDPQIAAYYFALIPKYYYAQRQMYGAHITIVRINKETPKEMGVWGKYEGQAIPFEYEPTIYFSAPYFYLHALSDKIGDIREELGLPRFREPWNSYHITIANAKR